MDNNVKTNLIDKIFFKKYRCLEYIGEGSKSLVYKAVYNNKYYALKLQDIKNFPNILSNEASIMIYLQGPNIPYISTYGSSGGYNIIAMQLLGENLQKIFENQGSFSIKTVCILAFQMISVLEHIHTKGIIHRDIKPENFLIGKDNNSKYLYLIDFGVSKFFDKNGLNSILIDKKDLIGSPRYASINALRGIEQSMRDDLESVGYVLVYFLKGRLPWMGIDCKDRSEKLKKICIRKIETSSSDLCSGLPKEFVEYMDYVKDLEYGQMPDYHMIKNLFLKILRNNKCKFDYLYDWNEPEKAKEKIKINTEFYSKSSDIANLDIINTTENMRPIITENINNVENLGKKEDRDENNDTKKKEEENKVNNNEEQKKKGCEIF